MCDNEFIDEEFAAVWVALESEQRQPTRNSKEPSGCNQTVATACLLISAAVVFLRYLL